MDDLNTFIRHALQEGFLEIPKTPQKALKLLVEPESFIGEIEFDTDGGNKVHQINRAAQQLSLNRPKVDWKLYQTLITHAIGFQAKHVVFFDTDEIASEMSDYPLWYAAGLHESLSLFTQYERLTDSVRHEVNETLQRALSQNGSPSDSVGSLQRFTNGVGENIKGQEEKHNEVTAQIQELQFVKKLRRSQKRRLELLTQQQETRQQILMQLRHFSNATTDAYHTIKLTWETMLANTDKKQATPADLIVTHDLALALVKTYKMAQAEWEKAEKLHNELRMRPRRRWNRPSDEFTAELKKREGQARKLEIRLKYLYAVCEDFLPFSPFTKLVSPAVLGNFPIGVLEGGVGSDYLIYHDKSGESSGLLWWVLQQMAATCTENQSHMIFQVIGQTLRQVTKAADFAEHRLKYQGLVFVLRFYNLFLASQRELKAFLDQMPEELEAREQYYDALVFAVRRLDEAYRPLEGDPNLSGITESFRREYLHYQQQGNDETMRLIRRHVGDVRVVGSPVEGQGGSDGG